MRRGYLTTTILPVRRHRRRTTSRSVRARLASQRSFGDEASGDIAGARRERSRSCIAMKFLHANAPSLSLERIRQLAHAHFDLSGDARSLYGERDQNTLFRERDASGWIVKVANRDEDPRVIDGQLEALAHIHRTDQSLPVPRPRLTREGRTTARLRTEEGYEHVIYALSYLEGRVAA